jgi:hypothetical protein
MLYELSNSITSADYNQKCELLSGQFYFHWKVNQNSPLFLTFGGSVGAGEDADLGHSLALAGDALGLDHRLAGAARVVPVHGELDVVLLSAEFPPDKNTPPFYYLHSANNAIGLIVVYLIAAFISAWEFLSAVCWGENLWKIINPQNLKT